MGTHYKHSNATDDITFSLFHVKGGLIAGHAAIQRSDLFTCLILSAAAVEIPDPRFSIWIVVSLILMFVSMYNIHAYTSI